MAVLGNGDPVELMREVYLAPLWAELDQAMRDRDYMKAGVLLRESTCVARECQATKYEHGLAGSLQRDGLDVPQLFRGVVQGALDAEAAAFNDFDVYPATDGVASSVREILGVGECVMDECVVQCMEPLETRLGKVIRETHNPTFFWYIAMNSAAQLHVWLQHWGHDERFARLESEAERTIIARHRERASLLLDDLAQTDWSSLRPYRGNFPCSRGIWAWGWYLDGVGRDMEDHGMGRVMGDIVVASFQSLCVRLTSVCPSRPRQPHLRLDAIFAFDVARRLSRRYMPGDTAIDVLGRGMLDEIAAVTCPIGALLETRDAPPATDDGSTCAFDWAASFSRAAALDATELLPGSSVEASVVRRRPELGASVFPALDETEHAHVNALRVQLGL